jgi:hypothetical protein
MDNPPQGPLPGKVSAFRDDLRNVISQKIGHRNVQVFMDTDPETMIGDRTWQEKILKELRTTTVFVSIMTANYLYSGSELDSDSEPACAWEFREYRKVYKADPDRHSLIAIQLCPPKAAAKALSHPDWKDLGSQEIFGYKKSREAWDAGQGINTWSSLIGEVSDVIIAFAYKAAAESVDRREPYPSLHHSYPVQQPPANPPYLPSDPPYISSDQPHLPPDPLCLPLALPYIPQERPYFPQEQPFLPLAQPYIPTDLSVSSPHQSDSFLPDLYYPLPVRKSRAVWKVIIVILVVGLFGGILTAIGISNAAHNQAEYSNFYVLGNDQIPSMKSVLGSTRPVRSFSESNANGELTYEIRYKVTDGKTRDMVAYFNYLVLWEGFLRLDDNYLSDTTGSSTLGKSSVEPDRVVTVELQWDAKGYTVTAKQYVGTITPN